MKRLWRFLFICAALCTYAGSFGQATPAPNQDKSKPLLFAALPNTFVVNYAELQKIFKADVNDEVHLQLSPYLEIHGTLMEKMQRNPASLSANIRVSNFSNALFNITLRLQADNSTSMQGRILHPRYGDVLLLSKEEDKYIIKKTTQALFMPE